MSALLIVDTHVFNYDKIVAAKKPTTDIVLFNSTKDSLDDIVRRVNDLSGAKTYESVGLVQEGTNRMLFFYKIVASQKSCLLQNLETTGLASWEPVCDFLKRIQVRTAMKTFDFISCLLDANTGFAYAITKISADIGVTLQASKDKTGNIAEGGNWIQESDGVNIQDVYFTADIVKYTSLLYTTVTQVGTRNTDMVTALNPGYAMVGDLSGIDVSGIDSSGFRQVLLTQTLTGASNTVYYVGNTQYDFPIDIIIAPASISGEIAGGNVQGIAATINAFATIDDIGRIYSWGNSEYGAKNNFIPGANYVTIAANDNSFAALDSSGNIYTWGYSVIEGYIPGTNFKAIAATNDDFAALDSSGNIFTFGLFTGATYLPIGNFRAIATNSSAFAALDYDGNIYTWGILAYGGYYAYLPYSNFKVIVASSIQFSALDTNGQIYTWGNTGNMFEGYIPGNNYLAIATNNLAFAALDTNQNVYAWGNPLWGGLFNYIVGTNYTALTANFAAFAALDLSGNVYTWGDIESGGIYDYIIGTNYQSIATTDLGFAALDTSGNVYVILNYESSQPAGFQNYIPGTNYTKIVGNYFSFAALDASGNIFTLGVTGAGGLFGYIPGTAYEDVKASAFAFGAAIFKSRCLSQDTSVNYPKSAWALENEISGTFDNLSPAIAVSADESVYYVKVYKNIPEEPIQEPECFPDYYPDYIELSGNADFYQIEIGKVLQDGTVAWKLTDPRLETFEDNASPSIVLGDTNEIFIAYVTNGSIPHHYNLACIPSFCQSNCASPGSQDIVMARIQDNDVSGSVVWVKQDASINSCNSETSPQLAIDRTNKLVYMAWSCSYTIRCYTPVGSNNNLLSCFDYNGRQLWIEARHLINSTGTNMNPTIAANNLGDVFIAWETTAQVNGGQPVTGTQIEAVAFRTTISGETYISHRRTWILSNILPVVFPANSYSPTLTAFGQNLYLAYLTNNNKKLVTVSVKNNGIVNWFKENQQCGIDNASTPYITTDAQGFPYLSLVVNNNQNILMFRFDSDNGNVQWASTPSSANGYYGYALSDSPYSILPTDSFGGYRKTPIAIRNKYIYVATTTGPTISIPSEGHTATYNDFVLTCLQQFLYLYNTNAFQYMSQNKSICGCTKNNCGC